MNLSIFWRLVWKEYRLQRALWIAMAVLTSFVLLLVYEFALDSQERIESLYAIAFGLPALYAIGCGAVLFAGEHEGGTYEFQRGLPIAASSVFFAKMAFAVVGTAALFAFTGLLAGYLSDWTLPGSDAHVLLYQRGACLLGFVMVLLAMVSLLWATLLSLITKRVLLAAILAIAAASMSVEIGGVVLFDVLHHYLEIDPHPFTWIALLAGIAVPLAIVVMWLGRRWFREKAAHGTSQAALQHAAPTETDGFSNRFAAPDRLALLRRLVWQHWRQSWALLVALVAIVIPVVVLFLAMVTALSDWQEQFGLYFAPWVGILCATVSVTLMGLCVFHSDQWRCGFRFLADRGVPPKYVWLSRQLPILVLAAALLPLVIILSLAPVRVPESQLFPVRQFLASTFTCVLLGLAVGQLWSMFLRSGVLAGLFSVLLTAVLVGWAALMRLWGVNLLWSVLPIPVAMLVATRLRTSDWLVERNTLRAWLRPGLVLLTPVVAILVAVPLYRTYEFPAVDPGFSPEEFEKPMTAEEKSTLDVYKQAGEKLAMSLGGRGAHELALPANDKDGDTTEEEKEVDRRELTAREIEWVNANQATIALTIKASQGPLVHYPYDTHGIPRLAELLLCSAMKVQDEKKLDAALEQYLAVVRIAGQLRHSVWWSYCDRTESEVYARLLVWATRPGQKPERIIAAARQLEKLTADATAGEDEIMTQYVWLRPQLSGDLDAISTRANDKVPTLTILWLDLPWERARAQRLLNILTRTQLDTISKAKAAAHRGERIPQPPWDDSWNQDPPYAIRTAINVPPISYGSRRAGEMVRAYTAMETVRRATRLILALQAWKLEHGSLPKTLEELVGSCLDRLPVDPYSGKTLRFFPKGLKIPLRWRGWHYSVLGGGGVMEANVPFVWAAGPGLWVRDPVMANAKPVIDEYYINMDPYYGRGDRLQTPLSEYDVWEAGWPFAIP